MIRIAITIAAFDAICATLPVGSVAVGLKHVSEAAEAEANERGERVVWLDEVWVDTSARCGRATAT